MMRNQKKKEYIIFLANTKDMKRKFNKGDMVGWKSDTDFTKENINKPPQKIIDYQKCIDGEGWEYKITNYIGWQMQHELELRT